MTMMRIMYCNGSWMEWLPCRVTLLTAVHTGRRCNHLLFIFSEPCMQSASATKPCTFTCMKSTLSEVHKSQEDGLQHIEQKPLSG